MLWSNEKKEPENVTHELKMKLALSGTYHNIEHAIIEAIHLLAPLSEYNDESARCKDIFKLVRESTICVDGQLQTGNHRFTIFSSALSGRRSSLKLFQKVSDTERKGSWWRLKVPYDEAQRIAHAIRLKNPLKYSDGGEFQSSFDFVFASRKEDLRNRFLSFVPLSRMGVELERVNADVETKLVDIQSKLAELQSGMCQEDKANFDQLVSMHQKIASLRRARRRQDHDVDGRPITFF
jgi:hypothetical protein